MTDLAAAPASLDRDARLAEDADRLLERSRRPALLDAPQALLAISATLLTSGFAVILLGWFGAARATIVEEQVPYLISGGLLGVALAVVGALTLFAHWLATLVREGREQEAARDRRHEELLQAIRERDAGRSDRSTGREVGDGPARGRGAQRPLRSAGRGT